MRILVSALTLIAAAALSQRAAQSPSKPQPPKTMRLYVFDCGVINVNRAGTERYKVTPEEVGETRFSVPCFLVAHPNGTLMWDLGILPDDTVEARARGEQGNPTATSPAVTTVPRTLRSQLAELGYRPADITFFAFSHAHVDHNANANQFAASTWLARPAERAFMWEEGNTRVNKTFFDDIKTSKSISLEQDEYDVFGDGKAIIKAAPGHSPGHQVLVLNLARTGRIMIAGDLYHYPQERTFHRPPPDTEFNVQQSAASRAMIEEYLKKTKTEIWIEHDFVANAKLRKSPAFYD
ncbi:MAG TPA: N-acyl homoserine lactonase family protein [Vicinamibacterales bacterium]|jgi:glyoxylase-like metal-dependent hydrolase (beta-lactamase superfamily II)